MTHIDEGVLQAYLDAEVTAGARAEIDKHLQGCSDCAAELGRLRGAALLFSNAVRHTDVQAPVLMAQARFAGVRRLERKAVAAPAAGPRRALARAAMFIVGLAAVAGAAVPGSPVRAWISDALVRAGLLDEPQSAAAPASPAEAPAVQRDASESTALAIDPVDGRVRVILKNVKPETSVTVSVIDGPRVVVEATGAASKARFRTGAGSLEMTGVDGGTIVVQIPRGVLDGLVQQDGKVIYRTGR
jgi:anti-sigma factor RsiW